MKMKKEGKEWEIIPRSVIAIIAMGDFLLGMFDVYSES